MQDKTLFFQKYFKTFLVPLVLHCINTTNYFKSKFAPFSVIKQKEKDSQFEGDGGMDTVRGAEVADGFVVPYGRLGKTPLQNFSALQATYVRTMSGDSIKSNKAKKKYI